MVQATRLIGHHIRSDKKYSTNSECVIVTASVLLLLLESMLQCGEHPFPITIVILDEAHELDCDTEACLALMPFVLQKYSEIKIFIMSATIDLLCRSKGV